jgi:hypothetical protein
MIDNQRVTQWNKDAMVLLMQSYGKDVTAAHMATIVLALIEDRRERENYCDWASQKVSELNERHP